ncbi:MAG: response regulator transcription factor [Pseudomonadota bacterium]
MINILIADDHQIIRSGLKHIVNETNDLVVAGEASNGYEVLAEISKNKYDVIVLDISMPGINWLDTLKHIKSKSPNIPVLILSIHPEDQFAVRALMAGASGYLTKESAPNELIRAIRTIKTGKKYVSLSLAENLAVNLGRDTEKPIHESLSDREYQVMTMIANGKSMKEIADSLSLSDKTISTYRSRILVKMKMKNNAELTRYAIKYGLVD